jgi:hypothetical protein
MLPPQSEAPKEASNDGADQQAGSASESDMVCVYCYRNNCEGCPLRFDDKITLRTIIESA